MYVCMYVCIYIYIYTHIYTACRVQFSKVQYGKMGPAPGRFELSP